MGEIEAARFAGIMAAKNEQIASAPADTVSASGSHEETPYSWAEINRPAQPQDQPSQHSLKGSAEYELNHFQAFSSKRHANADFVGSLCNCVGRDAVQSDC